MWNPLKKNQQELTPQEQRDKRVTLVDSQLRQTQAMFNMFIDNLEEVMSNINENKSASENQIAFHEQEIAAEKDIVNRLEKREVEANRVLDNVKKNFTINLDESQNVQNPKEDTSGSS